ncbi:MAG: tRNA (adenosine(37)-N6)-dimethylallyltransferase MiaA [Desulfobacterales bacterium]|jgi:tRNA dimethylallyltransferase|nr:tRNA (adenosine(37)-N6)-dimethylallyltransferase MiaA [Desulfobacterales bacterium]
MRKEKVVVICGPTGIGKTSLSLTMAGEFHGAIVGADSMQIYQYMDVGTAKPSLEERSRVPHFVMDIIPPDTPFDAAAYARLARESILKIGAQGRIPFIVGGTGFYIKALLHGLFDAQPSVPEVRQRLKEDAASLGSACVYERLAHCDPAAAARIHPNDTYRVIRALEIFEISGKPMSEFQKAHGFGDSPYEAIKIGLLIPRAQLYERIDLRVDQMIDEGLLNEVQHLLEMGFSPELRPMQALGYRHMVDYLLGRTSWDETIHILKRDTRRYAKRQLTWFQNEPDVIWKSPDAPGEIKALIRRFLDL